MQIGVVNMKTLMAVLQKIQTRYTVLTKYSTPGHTSKEPYVPLPRHNYTNVHSCSIHNSKDMEGGKIFINSSIENKKRGIYV